MLHSPSSALRHLISNTAIFILGDTAVVLRMGVGYLVVATDTEGLLVCTNVPTLVVIYIIGTFHVVVAIDVTLGTSSVGGTVLRTDSVTRF